MCVRRIRVCCVCVRPRGDLEPPSWTSWPLHRPACVLPPRDARDPHPFTAMRTSPFFFPCPCPLPLLAVTSLCFSFRAVPGHATRVEAPPTPKFPSAFAFRAAQRFLAMGIDRTVAADFFIRIRARDVPIYTLGLFLPLFGHIIYIITLR